METIKFYKIVIKALIVILRHLTAPASVTTVHQKSDLETMVELEKYYQELESAESQPSSKGD